MQTTIGWLSLAVLMSACQGELPTEKPQCNAEQAKQLLIQNLEKNVQQQALLHLQELTQ